MYRVSGIIRWLEGWEFSVCIGDRWLIIFLTYYLKNWSFKTNIYNNVVWRLTPSIIRRVSLRRIKIVCKQLTSHIVSRVSCLSPWERQNFLTYETEFVLYLAVLENCVLPMGWDSSHETLYVTSVVYKKYLRAATKYSEWRSKLAITPRLL